MVLLSTNGKIPKDRSWQKAKIMMSKVTIYFSSIFTVASVVLYLFLQIDQFLESLMNYDKENIHANIITAIEPYLKDKVRS